MVGEINYTATDGQGKAGVKTYLQYQSPSQIYIRQDKWGGTTQRTWMVTSDGKYFSYNTPSTVDWSTNDRRLVEPVMQNGVQLDYKKIYDVAAANSLGDRSMPLDVAIGEKADLEHLRLTWVNARDAGPDKIDGKDVHRITGGWRPYGNAVQDSSVYEMYVTDEGELLQYAVKRPYLVNNSTVWVTETWTVNLKINAIPDPKLFTLVK